MLCCQWALIESQLLLLVLQCSSCSKPQSQQQVMELVHRARVHHNSNSDSFRCSNREPTCQARPSFSRRRRSQKRPLTHHHPTWPPTLTHIPSSSAAAIRSSLDPYNCKMDRWSNRIRSALAARAATITAHPALTPRTTLIVVAR